MDVPNSIAKSLGALSVSQKLFEMSQDNTLKIKHDYTINANHLVGWPHPTQKEYHTLALLYIIA